MIKNKLFKTQNIDAKLSEIWGRSRIRKNFSGKPYFGSRCQISDPGSWFEAQVWAGALKIGAAEKSALPRSFTFEVVPLANVAPVHGEMVCRVGLRKMSEHLVVRGGGHHSCNRKCQKWIR